LGCAASLAGLALSGWRILGDYLSCAGDGATDVGWGVGRAPDRGRLDSRFPAGVDDGLPELRRWC